MSDARLQAEHLCAGYGRRVVVEDFSCAFRPGEVTVLLGRNGCGKSTLLRALGGLLPALKGRVLLDGQDMAAYRPARRAQLLATLPQGRDVPDITARRLVLHGRFPYLAYPRRYGPAEQALAEAALARVGIPDLADRPLKRLSGGQRQKVYLAMLLCQDSPVMLLDEPTTYLDIGCQLETWQLCRDLAAQSRTVVAVSHDIGQSLRYGHRVLLVEQGRLRMDAGPQEAAASGELERVFGVRIRPVDEDYLIIAP